MFSPQIHIVFNCQEDERIVRPIIDNPPNKLYYFTAIIRETGQRDVFLEFYNKNTDLLKEKIPSLEIVNREVDYTDYVEIIQELSKIIKFEREINPNCKIFINVSSGSKMTSNASVEASKLWNCEIYYVFAQKFDPYGEGSLHKGKIFVKSPIAFPIKKPEKVIVETLKIIEEMIHRKYDNKNYDRKKGKFIYLKDLILQLEDKGLIELDKKHKDKSRRKSALYMKARSFLNPLIMDLNYIKLSEDIRAKKVYLTEKGGDILKIFKFLI